MNISPSLFSLSIISLAVGLFLFFKPASAIEMQRKFYARINWRVEPISMRRELRNTRTMGLILIAAITIAIIVALAR